jgi:hypothetical protein
VPLGVSFFSLPPGLLLLLSPEAKTLETILLMHLVPSEQQCCRY